MNWIKASDFKWEPRKTYYAKWPDPDFIDIKGSGRFQESDGTYFWDTQGIVPVLKSKHHELLIIDEQDEGWVPVETPPPTNDKYNESDYYLCLHESGEQVVCWYNSNDKAWRVGNYKADSSPLTGITHYRKLPAPPATKD